MKYLINPDGQYMGRLEGTPAEIMQQVPPGHTSTILAPPRSTDYWDGTTWVPIGTPPAWYFKYDYKLKNYIDSRDIEKVKNDKWQQIKLERNVAEFGGFVHNNRSFDSDTTSQGRILAAYMFNRPVSWTLANDEVIILEVEDIQSVAMAMAEHVVSVHNKARLAREAILAATSITEVESVMFDGK